MRETVTWLVTIAYAALAAGLPLPAGAVVESPRHVSTAAKAGLLAAKDRSRPFPCMDSPCGCATAEQCFRECCCHSVAERLDWAKRNGLEAELLAVLQSRIATHRARAAAKPSGGCCQTAAAKPQPSCCAEASAGEPRCPPEPVEDSRLVREAICTGGGEAEVTLREDGRGLPVVDTTHDDSLPSVAAGREPDRTAPREAPRRRSVTLRALLACQGLVAEWMSVGGTLPPPVTETGTLPAPCGSIELVDAAAPSPPREPESPPPIAA